ncbi:MAG: hypothetical protein MUF81_00700 [Verrucomicrobia bacterium]|jgi:hypothetical protein|nr:hypothetical protein [Verrucomicrobiota bacterium]
MPGWCIGCSSTSSSVASTSKSLVLTQQQLNHAQQLQTTIQNLAVRVAQAGQTNAALAAVLKRQDLKVTLNNPDGQTKPTPCRM